MATRVIRLSLSLPEKDVTRTVVMSENSSIDMLRIVTCIAFGWEYYEGHISVDGTIHPPMDSNTPLKEILGQETYVSPVAGDGIKVRVEFGEVSDVPADKCPSIVGWEGEMPDLSESGVKVYRSGAEAMNDLNPQLEYNAAKEDPYKMKKKSVRGGSWKDPESYIRSAWRTWEYQNQPRSYIGFRCVRSLASTSSGKQKKK